MVDLGDPYRLEEYAANLMPNQASRLRDRMRNRHEIFNEISDSNRRRNRDSGCSPYPGAERVKQGQWITPFSFGLGSGLPVSGTTRWPGLITNMDIAPTILELLGVEESEPMIGRSVRIEPAYQGYDRVRSLEERLLGVARYRGVILRVLVAIQIVLYIGALGLLITNRMVPKVAIQFFQIALIIWLALPGCLLAQVGTFLVFVFGTGLILTYLFTRSPLQAVMAAALITGG